MAPVFGIVGGTGALGKAMALGVLKAGAVPAERLWVSNRSGALEGFERFPGVRVTANNQELADACDAILLCVPPAMAERVSIRAPDRLVLSVMAGVGLARLRRLSGAARVVRAMSSPAAEHNLAYSPWIASPEVSRDDRSTVERLLGACGLADEVAHEDHIDLFTALTGPVPGFVALYADCMIQHAVAKGVEPSTADRAVRQLFLAAGRAMAEGQATPGQHVEAMIEYAGTTAAGLTAMRSSPLARAIAEGLDAAVTRAKTIA